MRPFALLSVLFLCFSLNAQPGFNGRYYVDTLCSEYFFGRGYVNDGVNRAAYFISNQFDSIGLKPLGEKYFQEFPLTVNTFPERLALNVNGKKLKPGTDFQVIPESGGGKKKLKMLWVDTTQFLPANGPKSITILPRTWLNAMPGAKRSALIAEMASRGPLLLEAGEKLTWSVSDEQYKYPVFEVMPKHLKRTGRVKFVVDAVVAKNYYCNNVCAYVPGTQLRDSFLVITAHYDHLGGMGADTYIQGANDNASGTAMLLNLAAYFQQHPHKYSVVFIAFAAEEAGLIGSRYFVEHPLIDLSKIKFLFNLDLMGTGAEGATVVNATLFPKHFDKLLQVNQEHHYLTEIKPRGEAANSDHYWFSQKGVPSFFMYLLDSNYTAYHNVDDRRQALPLTRFDETCRLIIDFYNTY